MKASLRSLILIYTVALAFGVSFVVGGAMYWLSGQSLRRAYESRCESAAHEGVYQLLDPVYRLDAFAVKRLQDVLLESDESLVQVTIVDRMGIIFWHGLDPREQEPLEEIQRALSSGSWWIETDSEPWLFVGPIADATGVIHGAAAFEFSTDELNQDLFQMRLAALGTSLLVTFLGCCAGFMLARRTTRPFDRLMDWVQDIGAQRFGGPVHDSVRDSSLMELHRLATAMESMVKRLDMTTVSLEEAESARLTAERADRLKTRFLANLSHEIRTPLHAIVGHSDLLRAEGAGPHYDERLDGIQTAVRSLLRLIEDILDLSKIESENLKLALEPLDLERLIHEVIEITQVKAEPGVIDLRAEVAPGLQRWRFGDADRIRQILANLVSNALKFTDRGEVTISVLETSNEELRFVVQDTGRGIPEDEIENLFQPFARLVIDSARVSGSGLGLAICRQLAEAMGGKVRLESVVGEGTRAFFEIPLEVIADGVPLAQGSEGLPGENRRSERSFEGLRVLVVEDNPINQAVLSSMLELFRCEVRLADDGEAGVEQWELYRPSVIFMDCSMPILDGFEATRRIRHAEAEAAEARTAIVALTAHARKEDRVLCQEAGMDMVLTKPLALERLRETLATLDLERESGKTRVSGIEAPMTRISET